MRLSSLVVASSFCALLTYKGQVIAQPAISTIYKKCAVTGGFVPAVTQPKRPHHFKLSFNDMPFTRDPESPLVVVPHRAMWKSEFYERTRRRLARQKQRARGMENTLGQPRRQTHRQFRPNPLRA